MGKYSGYLICSDCDGTLTDAKQQISRKNAQAIRNFQREGGLFTLATGRLPDYVQNYRAVFRPNTYVVALNGTVLYDADEDKIVCGTLLDESWPEAAQAAADFCLSGVEILMSTGRETFRCFGSDREALKSAVCRLRGALYKIVFIAEESRLLRLKAMLTERFGGRYCFDRSWPEGMEMHERGSGKGEYVKKLRRMLGDQIHTTICVGDYENDVSMIEAADIGYAVGNAVAKARQAADRITVTNNESAIAEIIRSL